MCKGKLKDGSKGYNTVNTTSNANATSVGSTTEARFTALGYNFGELRLGRNED